MTSNIIMLLCLSLFLSLISLHKTSELDLHSLISIANQIEKRIPEFVYPTNYTIKIGDFDVTFTNLLLLINYYDRKANNIIKDEIHYYKTQLTLMFSMTITYLSQTNPIELKRSCGSFEAKAKDFYLFRQDDNSFSYELSIDLNSQSISKADWMEYALFESFEENIDRVHRALFRLMKRYLAYSIKEYPLAYAEYHFNDFMRIIANHNYYEFIFYRDTKEQVCFIRFTNLKYKSITKNDRDPYNSLFHDFSMHVFFQIGHQAFDTNVEVHVVMFGQNSISMNRFSKTPLIDQMMVDNIRKIFKGEFDKFNYPERYSIPIW